MPSHSYILVGPSFDKYPPQATNLVLSTLNVKNENRNFIEEYPKQAN